MKTIELYTAAELKAKHPVAFDRAFGQYKDSLDEIPWSDEIMDSLKAVYEAAGVRLRGYEINGLSGPSWVRFDMEQDVRDLQGVRGQAWLENNLFASLRIPFNGSQRWKLARYGQHYRPGMIKPGPFTGVCFDDDFLDSLNKSIRNGDTIGEAFENLANVAGNLRRIEWERQQEESYFLDHADANEYYYTKDGQRVR